MDHPTQLRDHLVNRNKEAREDKKPDDADHCDAHEVAGITNQRTNAKAKGSKNVANKKLSG